MTDVLFAGTAEVEITPPIGALMAGSLRPRPARGVTDPLLVKALVLECGGTRIAYVVFDIALLAREIGDRAVALASRETGIPEDHIIWTTSHTHSGPCTVESLYPRSIPGSVDLEWLNTLPERFAACVKEADGRKEPVQVSFARGYQSGLSQNRRLRFKDGREINTWLLNREEEDLQCVGAAAPIDPEVGMLAFDDARGQLIAVLYNFALHANSHFGDTFSADYPAVVASRLRERFGPQVTAFYAPGACGDINPCRPCRETGNLLADVIIARLASRTPMPVHAIGACKRNAAVPARGGEIDHEARLVASQWPEDVRFFFRETCEEFLERGLTTIDAPLHAWHIGDIAFGTFPGEAFVGLGLRLKRESPFPWTFPVELCGDYLGYLVTRQAWEAGGYESLLSSVGQVSAEGCEMMVDELLAMLASLRAAHCPA